LQTVLNHQFQKWINLLTSSPEILHFMANSYFRFKEFTVYQDACAMKVTTDACLFGAIAAKEMMTIEKLNVLDIGAGTGLLSMMFAQKNEHVLIDAVELDEAAAKQAKENCSQGIFKDRITVYHADIMKYNPGSAYDLVITNPPFYSNELKGPDEKKNKAHHDTGLRLPQLMNEIKRLLKPGGKLGLLLPQAKSEMFRQLAKESGWYCYKNVSVKQTPEHNIFRSILFFSKVKDDCREETLVIKEGNAYSGSFISLLSDYYLNL
jgi:tRNA1Val (adenine37-N6)-methyltransferase